MIPLVPKTGADSVLTTIELAPDSVMINITRCTSAPTSWMFPTGTVTVFSFGRSNQGKASQGANRLMLMGRSPCSPAKEGHDAKPIGWPWPVVSLM
jgi:hypothetical protein